MKGELDLMSAVMKVAGEMTAGGTEENIDPNQPLSVESQKIKNLKIINLLIYLLSIVQKNSIELKILTILY